MRHISKKQENHVVVYQVYFRHLAISFRCTLLHVFVTPYYIQGKSVPKSMMFIFSPFFPRCLNVHPFCLSPPPSFFPPFIPSFPPFHQRSQSSSSSLFRLARFNKNSRHIFTKAVGLLLYIARYRGQHSGLGSLISMAHYELRIKHCEL